MTHETSIPETDQTAIAASGKTAGDIMTLEIVSVPVGTLVRDVAALLLEKRISALPVLSADRRLVGMVSEGDLLGRSDADRVARRDWWLTLLKGDCKLAEPWGAPADRAVEHVMRAPVVTIGARAPLHEIAEMLQVHDIKRLPVMQGDQMVGVVSRSDLVRAMAAQAPKSRPGGLLGGLQSMFVGMMQTDVRADDHLDAPRSSAPAAERPPITAETFRTLVTGAKQAEKDEAAQTKQLAEVERLRRIKAMLMEHLGTQVWAELIDRAHAAAAQGENRFELIRFPCDLCSDGGRKIDVAETDWPTTLRGEAAEIFVRWDRELRPGGFRLNAEMVSYLDGMPSEVGLSLVWGAPGSSETKLKQ